MSSYLVSESSIHYVTGLLDRYADKFPTKHHQDAIREFRALSDKLLESLEMPMKVSIYRHQIKRD